MQPSLARWVVVAGSALVIGGCWQMQDLGVGQATDDDTGATHQATVDTDLWPPLEDEQGGAHDQQTGLVWQNPALYQLLNWIEARDYCQELEHAGYDDWRLPDVDELQSLLWGCPGAGACGVDDPGCLEADCDDDSNCDGCEEWGGPAAEGCYINPSLQGWCEIYWSESPAVPGFYRYWTVDYRGAETTSDDLDIANAVRCVRDAD